MKKWTKVAKAQNISILANVIFKACSPIVEEQAKKLKALNVDGIEGAVDYLADKNVSRDRIIEKFLKQNPHENPADVIPLPIPESSFPLISEGTDRSRQAKEQKRGDIQQQIEMQNNQREIEKMRKTMREQESRMKQMEWELDSQRLSR